MEKVKLTKKQAEIIKSIKDGTDDIANFLTHWHTAQDRGMVVTRENFTPSLLMKAWEYGYEVVFTPEDELKAEYDAHKNIASTGSQFYEGFHRGIHFALYKLNRLDIIGEAE